MKKRSFGKAVKQEGNYKINISKIDPKYKPEMSFGEFEGFILRVVER